MALIWRYFDDNMVKFDEVSRLALWRYFGMIWGYNFPKFFLAANLALLEGRVDIA
jgi:hypothetical protein